LPHKKNRGFNHGTPAAGRYFATVRSEAVTEQSRHTPAGLPRISPVLPAPDEKVAFLRFFRAGRKKAAGMLPGQSKDSIGIDQASERSANGERVG